MEKQKVLVCTASPELDNFIRNFSKDFEITEETNIKRLIDTIQSFNPDIIVLTEKYLASTKVEMLLSYFRQIRFYSNARILYFTPRSYGDILIHSIITNYHVYDLFLGSNINTLEFKKSLYQGKLLKDVSHLLLKDDQLKTANIPTKEIVEVEKIVERIVEVERPVEVEKIIEIEKIVEKPVEVERIVERLVEVEKVIEKHTSDIKCKVIGVFSSTDNIGKTFISSNIGYMLSKDKKVALLTLDKTREGVFYFSSFIKSSPEINGIFEIYKINPNYEFINVRSNATGVDIYEFNNEYIRKFDVIIYDMSATNNIDTVKSCLSICDDSIFVCDTSIVNVFSLGRYLDQLQKNSAKFKGKKSLLINEHYISQFINKENIINIINQSSDIQFDNIYRLNSYRPLSIECLYKGVPIVEYNSIVSEEFDSLINDMKLNKPVEQNSQNSSEPVNPGDVLGKIVQQPVREQKNVAASNTQEQQSQAEISEANEEHSETKTSQELVRVPAPTFGQGDKNQPVSVGRGLESKDKVEDEKNKMRKRFIYKMRSN